MAASLKPIRVWGQGGPNPPKVALLLHELGVPAEIVPIPFSEVKSPQYTSLNPNGRLPAIQDPNTGITLWESGAITEYLIATYDKDHSISFPAGSEEDWHAKQWLYFQVSGQGPYYGQAIWFSKMHPEKLPSARERYIKEINRVTGVLNAALEKRQQKEGGGPWLVGNKKSFADLSFILWQNIVGGILPKEDYDVEAYPFVKKWIEKMTADDAVQKILKAAHPGQGDVWEGFEKYGL